MLLNKDNLIIRVNREKELFLTLNREGVYFLWQYGEDLFNSLDYDEASNYFNMLQSDNIFS